MTTISLTLRRLLPTLKHAWNLIIENGFVPNPPSQCIVNEYDTRASYNTYLIVVNLMILKQGWCINIISSEEPNEAQTKHNLS